MIFAGILIGIGCIVFLTVGGVEGAILFSIGLCAILAFGLKLYTGKVGDLYTRDIKIEEVAEIYVGNAVGATLCGFVARSIEGLGQASATVMKNRLDAGFLGVLVLSVFCGILMYVAVKGFQQTKSWLFAVLPIAVFVSCGFAHSVADWFYFAASGTGFEALCISTFGNAIGANLAAFGIKDCL